MSDMIPLYQAIASTLAWARNAEERGNAEWGPKARARLQWLVDQLPSGSGIDIGPSLDEEASDPDRKLVFTFSYHHMNGHGCYDGWTDHTLIVRPSLQDGIDLRITGKDRNQIKEYLHEVFHHALTRMVSRYGVTESTEKDAA